ncbi:uncharacterized protein [Atheta coriaria]|uniref:uncharacterized protein n=1 Tax=Dalotia coriaria TaxID=877792 RepID=UPI0031F33D0E
MRTIFLLFSICTLNLYEINAHPLESTTIEPFSSTAQNLYVLSALEHHETVPSNAIEIKPDEMHTDIPDDHILKKKIIALPLSDVKSDTKVLTNEQGQAIMAHSSENFDEGMNTAESGIVFRPLFAYRRQQAAKRRFYVPARNYNYRGQSASNQDYVPNCNRRKYYSEDRGASYNRPYRNAINSRYPDWYHNAEFPALI